MCYIFSVARLHRDNVGGVPFVEFLARSGAPICHQLECVPVQVESLIELARKQVVVESNTPECGAAVPGGVEEKGCANEIAWMNVQPMTREVIEGAPVKAFIKDSGDDPIADHAYDAHCSAMGSA
jgi:hypothetical protein